MAHANTNTPNTLHSTSAAERYMSDLRDHIWEDEEHEVSVPLREALMRKFYDCVNAGAEHADEDTMAVLWDTIQYAAYSLARELHYGDLIDPETGRAYE